MSKSSNPSGTSILGTLGIAFIVLKLCKVIDWSWWWVLAPFWGGLALVITFATLAFTFTAIQSKRDTARREARLKSFFNR